MVVSTLLDIYLVVVLVCFFYLYHVGEILGGGEEQTCLPGNRPSTKEKVCECVERTVHQVDGRN
jgi:hypothetical protein